MSRFYQAMAWTFTSLGTALLMCAALLVPTQRALADPGPLASCPSHCSTTTCTGSSNNGGCSADNNACNQTSDTTCANCGCSDPDGNGCRCVGAGIIQQ